MSDSLDSQSLSADVPFDSVSRGDNVQHDVVRFFALRDMNTRRSLAGAGSVHLTRVLTQTNCNCNQSTYQYRTASWLQASSHRNLPRNMHSVLSQQSDTCCIPLRLRHHHET